MNEKIKDFAKPEYSDPIMDMSEFFIENPHYMLLRYKPINNGIRAFYVTIN